MSSIKYIKVDEHINDNINVLSENDIVLLYCDNGIEYKEDVQNKVLESFNYDKVGFVYTDLILKRSNGIDKIIRRNGLDIFNQPLFIKKKFNFQNLDGKDPEVLHKIALAYAHQGFFFSHIADFITVW